MYSGNMSLDYAFDRAKKLIVNDNDKKLIKTIAGTAMLIGLICYFYTAVLGYSGPDAIIEGNFYYSNGATALSMGRWLIYYVNTYIARNLVVAPIIILFYCVFIAVSVFLLCKMFDICKTWHVVLVTASFISFHVVMHHFAFMYMAVFYAIAFFLSVLAVFLIRKKKLVPLLFAILCILFMLGAYQACIGAVAALALILFLTDCLWGKNVKCALTDLGKAIFAGIIACALDVPIMNFAMRINGIETSDRISSNPLVDIVENLDFSLKYSYRWFFSFFFNDDVLSRNYIYAIILGLIALMVLSKVILLLLRKKWLNAFCALAALFLMPLAMNMCQVLFPHVAISDIMRYQYVLIIALTFSLLNTMKDNLAKYTAEWTSFLLVVLLVFTYVISANATAICYKLAYESTYTKAVQIMSDVYDLEGYEPGETRVLFGGCIDYQTTYESHALLFRYAHMEPGPVFWGGMYGATASRYSYMMDYLGIDTGWISDIEYRSVICDEEFVSMPVWPKNGSVRMIGDFAVVKLAENP